MIDAQLFSPDFFDINRALLKHLGSEILMNSHNYPHEYYSEHFTPLKTSSLSVSGKVVVDMLAYCEQNGMIGDTVSQMQSLLTFSDSAYSLERGDPSIVV